MPDPVDGVVGEGDRVALVCFASDAGASLVGERTFAKAIAGGNAVSVSSKSELGALFGRDELAVLGILDRGVGRNVSRLVRFMTSAPASTQSHGAETLKDLDSRKQAAGAPAVARSEACNKSQEVR